MSGIVSSRHEGANNASYAIKTSYLLNLFDNLDNAPKLDTSSRLKGKTLADQVKDFRGFTYIVEVD